MTAAIMKRTWHRPTRLVLSKSKTIEYAQTKSPHRSKLIQREIQTSKTEEIRRSMPKGRERIDASEQKN